MVVEPSGFLTYCSGLGYRFEKGQVAPGRPNTTYRPSFTDEPCLTLNFVPARAVSPRRYTRVNPTLVLVGFPGCVLHFG